MCKCDSAGYCCHSRAPVLFTGCTGPLPGGTPRQRPASTPPPWSWHYTGPGRYLRYPERPPPWLHRRASPPSAPRRGACTIILLRPRSTTSGLAITQLMAINTVRSVSINHIMAHSLVGHRRVTTQAGPADLRPSPLPPFWYILVLLAPLGRRRLCLCFV